MFREPLFRVAHKFPHDPLGVFSLRLYSANFGWGGTNLSDAGLNLRGSWQQGHSASYNTPSRI